MDNKLVVALLACLVILGGFSVFRSAPKSVSPLGNALYNQINAGDVINGSSSVTAVGGTVITNASNTGLWFRLTNTSPQRFFCGAGTATTTIGAGSGGGQFLSPVTSSTAGTGSNSWEMFNFQGAITCISIDATGVLTWSYTGK